MAWKTLWDGIIFICYGMVFKCYGMLWCIFLKDKLEMTVYVQPSTLTLT